MRENKNNSGKLIDRPDEVLGQKQNAGQIPQIELVDLEQEDRDSGAVGESGEEFPADDRGGKPKTSRGLVRFLNLHTLLLLVVIVFVVCIYVKFRNWGVFIDQADIIPEEPGEYHDVLDMVLPLMTETGERIPTGPAENIMLFGNSPFADDRGEADNLASLIAEKTGATVYNCSIGDSYLAAQSYAFNADEYPMDAYTFYWLVTYGLTGVNERYYTDAAAALGEDTPEDAEEVLSILKNVDMAEMDVIGIMYDATDYLLGHPMYSDQNYTDTLQFTGNLEAGIELIQANCPNTRIIIMSPTYAYAVTEDGEYVSSDMYIYGQDVLSTYSLMQMRTASFRSVTYIDNLYGTITEDNAKRYLIDNLHLNTAGRELVANRFVDAVNAYNQPLEEEEE